MEAERIARLEEKRRRRAEWWRRNRKWFFIAAIFIALCIVGIRIHNNRQDRIKEEKQQAEQRRRDSIAEVDRKTWLKDQIYAFESFTSKPMNMNNVQQVISEGYGILCPLCDTLDKYPSLSVSTSRVFIDRYNGRVDEAIKVIDEAVIDPNLSSELLEDMTRNGNKLKQNIEQMRYKK